CRPYWTGADVRVVGPKCCRRPLPELRNPRVHRGAVGPRSRARVETALSSRPPTPPQAPRSPSTSALGLAGGSVRNSIPPAVRPHWGYVSASIIRFDRTSALARDRRRAASLADDGPRGR